MARAPVRQIPSIAAGFQRGAAGLHRNRDRDHDRCDDDGVEGDTRRGHARPRVGIADGEWYSGGRRLRRRSRRCVVGIPRLCAAQHGPRAARRPVRVHGTVGDVVRPAAAQVIPQRDLPERWHALASHAYRQGASRRRRTDPSPDKPSHARVPIPSHLLRPCPTNPPVSQPDARGADPRHHAHHGHAAASGPRRANGSHRRDDRGARHARAPARHGPAARAAAARRSARVDRDRRGRRRGGGLQRAHRRHPVLVRGGLLPLELQADVALLCVRRIRLGVVRTARRALGRLVRPTPPDSRHNDHVSHHTALHGPARPCTTQTTCEPIPP